MTDANPSMGGRRPGEWLADRVALLAGLAVALALAAPSRSLARRSDLLLSILVLFTAIAIEPRRLIALRERPVTLAVLSLAPFLGLTAIAWVLSRPFGGATRDGVLSLGLSSSEVASVGLVALAGGDVVLALGVLTGSLVAAAVLGPVLAVLVAHTSGHAGGLRLLGRFALVVLVPLTGGLVLRRLLPRLADAEDAIGGLSALTVCLLLYAALSGLNGGRELLDDALGSLAFMIVAGGLAILATRLIGHADAPTVGLTTWLRDFAVAAALATQAFGPSAASVAGVYGALMLLGGAITATLLRRGKDPGGVAGRQKAHSANSSGSGDHGSKDRSAVSAATARSSAPGRE
jgi:BASS family bile acid:Na+ symporter